MGRIQIDLSWKLVRENFAESISIYTTSEFIQLLKLFLSFLLGF